MQVSWFPFASMTTSPVHIQFPVLPNVLEAKRWINSPLPPAACTLPEQLSCHGYLCNESDILGPVHDTSGEATSMASHGGRHTSSRWNKLAIPCWLLRLIFCSVFASDFPRKKTIRERRLRARMNRYMGWPTIVWVFHQFSNWSEFRIWDKVSYNRCPLRVRAAPALPPSAARSSTSSHRDLHWCLMATDGKQQA